METKILKQDQILQLIPHKPPFLFVDRIIRCDDKSICGEKTFFATESFFQGHYPGNPIVPGAILLEMMAQTAAVLTALRGFTKGKTGYLMKVQNFRFKGIVNPGDLLLASVILDRVLDDCYFFSGQITNSDKVTADGEFIVKIKGD